MGNRIHPPFRESQDGYAVDVPLGPTFWHDHNLPVAMPQSPAPLSAKAARNIISMVGDLDREGEGSTGAERRGYLMVRSQALETLRPDYPEVHAALSQHAVPDFDLRIGALPPPPWM